MQHWVFAHAFQRLLRWWCVGGVSSFVGYPKGQSVIEEKGEGFENGKISVGAVGVALNLF